MPTTIKLPLATIATFIAALLALTAVALSAELPDCSKPIAALSLDELSFCEATQHFKGAMLEAQAQERARVEREARKGKPGFFLDPGAESLCPAPHRMTTNGCK